ncbi:MAG: HAD-IG family 5'-nucleotidase [Myxococcota bacterium]|nr:HAD-IG family 5'-nucleotidase [Myxococcota bacterium]
MSQTPTSITLAPTANYRPPEDARRVFVNRNLRLDNIKAFGFDMDYTIARYFRVPIETLAYDLTLKNLVEIGYPERLLGTNYDADFVIRGLTVDTLLGNIIKLDRHNHVSLAFHGRRPLTKEEKRTNYRHEKTRFDDSNRFQSVDTFFELPEICLYADLIHFFEMWGTPFNPHKLFQDTRDSIDKIHRDGSLKSIIKADLDRYIIQDPELPMTLHKLRSSGKKLFLLTNSHWEYTNTVMSFLLDGKLDEYSQWRDYFDLAIVAATKPGFWQGEKPFIAIKQDGRESEDAVTHFEKGGIYKGGNVNDFEQLFGLAGEQLLYVGDHIYGDILRSKRNAMWRTALVVEELEEELTYMTQSRHLFDKLSEVTTRQQELDEVCNDQRQELSFLSKEDSAEYDTAFRDIRVARDENKVELKKLIEERGQLESRIDRGSNEHWGMVFKQGQENSRFGQQVQRYACIYTSRVSNFYFYSNYQYFRSLRDLLPHEITL